VNYLATNHELYLLMYDLIYKRRKLKSKKITSKYISVDPWIFATAFIAKYAFRASIYRHLCTLLSPSYKFNRTLKEILQENEINILQCENAWSIPHSLTVAKEMNIPVIATLHDVVSDRTRQLNAVLKKPPLISRKINKMTDHFEKKAVNSTDFNVCVSEDDKNSFTKMGVDPNKLMVIPNGVDSNEFYPREKNHSLIAKLGLENANPILLFAGSEMYQNRIAVKDIITKIVPKAANVYKNLRVLIVGTVSKYVNNLKQNFPKLSKHIIDLGFVDNLNQYYSIADIVLIPLRYGTGTKLKVVEAMAAGKCIISTEIGIKGIAVKKQNMVVIEDDMSKYVDHIFEIMENYEYRKKLEKNARKKAFEYDWKQIFKGYDEIYNQIA
jgi:glycosyltransferase involved in cell wall biosynthesis